MLPPPGSVLDLDACWCWLMRSDISVCYCLMFSPPGAGETPPSGGLRVWVIVSPYHPPATTGRSEITVPATSVIHRPVRFHNHDKHTQDPGLRCRYKTASMTQPTNDLHTTSWNMQPTSEIKFGQVNEFCHPWLVVGSNACHGSMNESQSGPSVGRLADKWCVPGMVDTGHTGHCVDTLDTADWEPADTADSLS